MTTNEFINDFIVFRNFSTNCLLNIKTTPCKYLYASFIQLTLEELFIVNYTMTKENINASELCKVDMSLITNGLGSTRLLNRYKELTNVINPKLYSFIDMFISPILCTLNEVIENIYDYNYTHIMKKILWLSFIQIEGIHVTCKSINIENNCSFDCDPYKNPYIIIYLLDTIPLITKIQNIYKKLINKVAPEVKIVFDCSNLCEFEDDEFTKLMREIKDISGNREFYLLGCGLFKNVIEKENLKVIDRNKIKSDILILNGGGLK